MALAREKDRLSKWNKQKADTEEQAALAREKQRVAKRRKRQTRSEKHDGDMENVINQLMKEAVKSLHRTKDPVNPCKHRAIVCIICDCCIIGTESIHTLTKDQISVRRKRLSAESYEEYYETTLKSKVTKQYEVDGLIGLLLSPWSRRDSNGYATCSVCYSGMQPKMADKKTPPKLAIANEFVIESFPQEIQFFNKDGEKVKRKIEEYELTDIVKTMAAQLDHMGVYLPFLEVPKSLCEEITSFLRWIIIVLKE